MDQNVSCTENGDRAFSTSGSACLDFFTRITRNAPVNDYIDAFSKAWKENKETAIRILMNMRDIRGGKGEKLIPRVLMVYLKNCLSPEEYKSILQKMIEYGCWVDLLYILKIELLVLRADIRSIRPDSTDPNSIEIKLFADQLFVDEALLKESEVSNEKNENVNKKALISLCGKWAPSENCHYDTYLGISKHIRTAMGKTPKEYRKMLTKMRKHLNILEMLMSTQRFDEIDFSKIPSIALKKMNGAFKRDTNSSGIQSDERVQLHCSYDQFLNDLAKGKTKVNVKGIQPHELVSTYLNKFSNVPIDLLVEGQWEELKKRVKQSGAFSSVTAIVDVSGSMKGQPMEVAIALGILVAECTEGPFYGKIITFDTNPQWHHLDGTNLKEKVYCLSKAKWGGSTNLGATFDMILRDAVNAKLKPHEMVKTLFIFTDMQFDSVCGGYCDSDNDQSWESTFSNAKRTFQEKGYELPNIVCWNLRTSISKSMPVEQKEQGYSMLSGFSAELLKCILTAQEFSPMAMMMHVLEPYAVPELLQSCQVDSLVPRMNNFVSNLEKILPKSHIKKAYKSNVASETIINSMESDNV